MVFHRQTGLMIVVAVLLASCSKETGEQLSATTPAPETGNAPGPVLTTVYFNADIVTVDDQHPTAEALAVRNGRILAVGSRADVEAIAGNQTRLRDLQGRTVIPGLIDAHGHISITGLISGFANIQPPPAGPLLSITQLKQILKTWHEQNPDAPWIVGWGYDDSLLKEGRHPTRWDLDEVSSEVPILLSHVSGHLLACNSKCLELAGITAQTENPPGGVIRRVDGSREPNGVLEEKAVFLPYAVLPLPPAQRRLKQLDAAQQYYASYGVTTVQDGAAELTDIAVLEQAAAAQKLYMDVVAYRTVPPGSSLADDFVVSQDYRDHLRIGGIKFHLDGSPQGKTAWLTKPYFHPPEGLSQDYRGYPIFEDEELTEQIKTAYTRNIPVLLHANGDASADQLIKAVSAADKDVGHADRRTVMIHAQTVREDQIDQMQTLGIIPSYFVAHTFYWGDWHRDSVLGEERAFRISPLQSTVSRGMIYTTHNDSPVVPPDMMRLLWTGVNRVTRSGQVLGVAQRVSPLEALKSMTINAAYQYFEEDSKGSIVPGKLADLVILSDNPLKVDPMTIKDIQVLETIKEGETIFRAD